MTKTEKEALRKILVALFLEHPRSGTKQVLQESREETSTKTGVNPFDQTSVQVKLCCSESRPPQIPQEAHTRGWNVTASYCTHPR